MPPTTVAALLGSADQRYTSGRKRIVAALRDGDGPMTIPQILDADRSLAQSSVYQDLVVLEEVGAVTRIVTRDDFARYELAEDLTEHHHPGRRAGQVSDFALTPAVEADLDEALPTSPAARTLLGRGPPPRPRRRVRRLPMSEPLPPAMFLTDGDGFVGTALARGPWDEGAAHGGPVARLIGEAVERYGRPDARHRPVHDRACCGQVPLARHRRADHHRAPRPPRPPDRCRSTTAPAPSGPGHRLGCAADDGAPVAVHDGPRRSAPGGRTAAIERRPTASASQRRRAAQRRRLDGRPRPATYWFRVRAARRRRADHAAGADRRTSQRHRQRDVDPDPRVHQPGPDGAPAPPTHRRMGGQRRPHVARPRWRRAEATLYDADGPIGSATQHLYVAAR
ncbi:MAG: transcriptional repressor [Acidimicrobiales bacterium]